jgi:hypothetical protein
MAWFLTVDREARECLFCLREVIVLLSISQRVNIR